jgi:hypothetical protein
MNMRKRVVYSGILLLTLLTGVGLYFFGPQSEVCLLCRVCGRYKANSSTLGVTWYEAEVETELSKWYCQVKLPLHEHEWVPLCSTYQHWGGGGEHFDWFGFEVGPLWRLKEVSEKVDQTTFKNLTEDYLAARQDRTKFPSFFDKCNRLAPEERARPDQ